MLREGVKITGDSIEFEGLSDPNCVHIEGIPHSEPLLRFANAYMGDDEAALVETRDALAKAMGPEAMVDAVGVASNFQRMDRIADATGIPADAPTAIMQKDLAEKLGTNKYVSAGNTKPPSWFTRLIMKLIVIPKMRKKIRDKSK